MRWLVPCAAALALAAGGCVHFQPRPISPERTLAAFSSRSLDDAGLRRFLHDNGAPSPGPTQPWDLQGLTLAAFYFSPDLDVARADLAAARAAKITAAGRQNPSVAFSPGYSTSTPAGTISPWILTFNLDIPLTTAGKRGYTIAQASSLAEGARFQFAAAAWAIRSRVRASLVELEAARAAETLQREQESILAENAGLLDRQLAAGEAAPPDVTQAHLALASARAALADAGARAMSARAALADAIGVPADALTAVIFSPAGLDGPEEGVPTAEAKRKAVLNRADVLAALAQYAASQSALQLEIARQYPDIHLGPGYEFDQSNDKWFLGLSLSLPIVNRNRGPIAEAEAARGAAAARFVAIQAHALAEIDAAAAGLTQARAAAAEAANAAADQEKRERAVQARFAAGDISRVELDGARLEVVAAQLALLDARSRAQAAIGRLENAMQCTSEPIDRIVASPRRAGGDAGSGGTR
jgi:outer membrane protein, heavy metal efflux system